jgi:4-diphosphocytidyl-2-C-methyl-D-erythritol kinase
MPGLTAEAPCKINLHLRIGEKRADGFHDLESIFVPLAFGDTIRVSLPGGDGPPVIRMKGEGLPLVNKEEFPLSEENILFKTAVLFGESSGFTRKIAVTVVKRIPLGGGLGGGSSDAAALLVLLNHLGGTSLSREKLAELAEKLGSDVPFFLLGGAAWVSGRGERLLAAEFPAGMSVVLVNPGFPSDTALAYRLLDEYRLKNGFRPREVKTPGEYTGALGQNPRDWPFENDFLTVFPDFTGENDKSPGAGAVYRKILSGLRGLGADFAGLSGSGSTCFGIFGDGGMAAEAVETLSKEWPFVRLTFFLARELQTVLQ